MAVGCSCSPGFSSMMCLPGPADMAPPSIVPRLVASPRCKWIARSGAYLARRVSTIAATSLNAAEFATSAPKCVPAGIARSSPAVRVKAYLSTKASSCLSAIAFVSALKNGLSSPTARGISGPCASSVSRASMVSVSGASILRLGPGAAARAWASAVWASASSTAALSLMVSGAASTPSSSAACLKNGACRMYASSAALSVALWWAARTVLGRNGTDIAAPASALTA